MKDTDRFLQRITYRGPLATLLHDILAWYGRGPLDSYDIVQYGYEDLNCLVVANKHKYFVKIVGSHKSKKECQRFLSLIHHAHAVGIQHPVLMQSKKGVLYEHRYSSGIIRAVLMEYIEGKTLYQGNNTLSWKDTQAILRQTALLSTISYKPAAIYDSWALIHLPKEYKKKKQTIAMADQQYIEKIVKQFKKIPLAALPFACVHGDLRSTNIMINSKGEICIIDFGVANWYPRIVELAVLFSEVFFDPTSPIQSQKLYQRVLAAYTKQIQLTKEERIALPVFIHAAHAMHVIGPSYAFAQGNVGEENKHWLTLGKKGIRAPMLSSVGL